MPDPPPRVYARQLLPLGYGYPLWTPESSNQFLRYRRDGLRIGDVGVIDPEDGSFDVFFNICVPAEDPFHRANGVPDNFAHINLDELDLAVFPYAENSGSVISTSSVTTLRTIEPPPGSGPQNALTYEFSFSSSEGALLILPEGAQRYALRRRSIFRDVATRNGADWYKFAEQKLGRIITHDSLYLITGCYKSHSWSVTAFNEVSSQIGATEFPAQFKAGQAREGTSNISTAYTWETTRALHWRVGPLGDWNGIPNQAVFISGFKIAIRDSILGRKWIEVEVDAPPTDLQPRKIFSSGRGQSRAGKLWRRLVSKGGGNNESVEHAAANSANEQRVTVPDESMDASGLVTLTHIPETLQSNHPSDILNRYLLSKVGLTGYLSVNGQHTTVTFFAQEPSAAVAVTHDSQWCILLERGILKSEDLAHDGRLEGIVSENYHLVSQDGFVCLEAMSDSSIRLMDIDDEVRKAWKNDKLGEAEEILSGQTIRRTGSDHSAFAYRALIRARLRRWDEALRDAETSIDIQSSVTAYVAKGFALFGQNEYALAVDAFNSALRDCDARDKDLVSLIKCIVSFEVGHQTEGIADIADLMEQCLAEGKSACSTVQAEMSVRLAKLATKKGEYDGALQYLTRAQTLGSACAVEDLDVTTLICGWRFGNLQFTTRQQICEVLYAAGRTKEAVGSFGKMMHDIGGDVKTRKDNVEWITTFAEQCLKSPESFVDDILVPQNPSEVTTHYPATLSTDPMMCDDTIPKAGKQGEMAMVHETLESLTPTPLLREWVEAKLVNGSWKDAVVASNGFMVPTFTIYRAVCERLETLGQITEATECFHYMMGELGGETNLHDEQVEWVTDFKQRFCKKLECLGDAAADAENLDEAILNYTAALSLDPTSPQNLFVRRSKIYMAKGSWGDALSDVDEAIELDPSSPWGYERKHAALHKAGDYDNAIVAFEAMLSKISQSPDPEIRERGREYVNPEQTRTAIRSAIQDAINKSTRVLVNTHSFRYHNKSEQAAAFESLPVFSELVSSMTTHIDRARIEREVTQYCRLAAFSHKWDHKVPLFEKQTPGIEVRKDEATEIPHSDADQNDLIVELEERKSLPTVELPQSDPHVSVPPDQEPAPSIPIEKSAPSAEKRERTNEDKKIARSDAGRDADKSGITDWIKPKRRKDLLPVVAPPQPRPRSCGPPRPMVRRQELPSFAPGPGTAPSIPEKPASRAEGRTEKSTKTRARRIGLPSLLKPKRPKELLPVVEPPQPRPRTHVPPRPAVYQEPAKSETALSVTTENAPSSTLVPSVETAEMRHSDARQRFVNAIRSVVMLQSTSRPASFTTRPSSPTLVGSSARLSDPGVSSRGMRVTGANIDKLMALDTSQEMTVHQALVRHLQFSPNGKYLATSSWDRTTVIFRVGESFTTHRILVHVRGFVGQVAWSPNGRILLTRLTRVIKVWSEDGVCKKTIDRQNTVQSVVWLPTGDAFLSVEGSEVVKLDLHGKVLDTYHLGQVRLVGVAVTPDCSRLIGTGPSIPPPSGPQPGRHTRVEKRIIAYNMQTRTKENQVPFARDIRDITMARRTAAILVSPEKAAPQLWKLEIVRDRDRIEYAQTSRLSLKHTFALDGLVDIAGPSQFGGKDDQFVLCAGKAGSVHIWDRETAALLHRIQPLNTPGVADLICMAWNYATDEPMMLATGSHDGTVRIYSTAPSDERSDNESYLERHTEGDRATVSSDSS